MTFKLCLRLALLTGLLMILLSTFKTQQTAACSPGWYDGCVSRCDSQYDSCLNGWITWGCTASHDQCTGNCDQKLAACYAN